MLCRYWSSWIPFYSVDQVSISNIKSINQFFVQNLLSVIFHEDKNNLRFTPTISVLGIIWFVDYSNYTHFLFHINLKIVKLKYCFEFLCWNNIDVWNIVLIFPSPLSCIIACEDQEKYLCQWDQRYRHL